VADGTHGGNVMSAATWIHNALTTDATITGKVGNRVYRDSAPEGTAFPFVVYQLIDSLPVHNAFKDELLQNERWQIRVVDVGHDYTDLDTISDQVETLLHKKSASGVLSSYFEMKVVQTELDKGKTYKSVILDFRVQTQ
jgi:hypothetical protein